MNLDDSPSLRTHYYFWSYATLSSFPLLKKSTFNFMCHFNLENVTIDSEEHKQNEEEESEKWNVSLDTVSCLSFYYCSFLITTISQELLSSIVNVCTLYISVVLKHHSEL